MNKKNLKGFTLIELMAVIIILAIIALIAIPIVTNIIAESKKSSAVISIQHYISSINDYIAKADINGDNNLQNGYNYQVTNTTTFTENNVDKSIYLKNVVSVKGTLPVDGYTTVNNEQVSYGIFSISGYIVECPDGESCYVKGPSGVSVPDSIQLSPSTVSIGIASTTQLTSTLSPISTINQNITWSSSDNSIATVSATGLVTGVATGTVTITATTVNNKTDSVQVTVTTPLTISSINKTLNSLSINYSVNSGGTGQNTYTCAIGTTSSNYNISGTATSSTCNVSGLNADTTYYYQVCSNSYCQTGTAKTAVNAVTMVENLSGTPSNSIRVDSHAATGSQNFASTDYRYFGSNPNNYVSFNGELWRMIGVSSVDDGTGNVAQRIKLIRASSIGNYSLDSSDSSVNGGFGVNEWSQSDLMTLLNSGAYYNKTSGNCYNNSNNGTNACDFSSNGLGSSAKSMIDNAKWYTSSISATGVVVSSIYSTERMSSSNKACSSGTYCNDTVSRNATWTGKVGIQYLSDYMYATDNSLCNLSTITPGSFSQSTTPACTANDWLFTGGNEWSIDPFNNASESRNGLVIYYQGWVTYFSSSDAYIVRPAVYLKSSITVNGGTGTSSNPYTLGLN